MSRKKKQKVMTSAPHMKRGKRACATCSDEVGETGFCDGSKMRSFNVPSIGRTVQARNLQEVFNKLK